MDALSPFISVLCHSDWIFHGEYTVTHGEMASMSWSEHFNWIGSHLIGAIEISQSCNKQMTNTVCVHSLVVKTLDLQLSVAGSIPSHDTAWLFLRSNRWLYFASKLSWDITTTQVNSALHPSEVAKSSTCFGWGRRGKVTAAGWHLSENCTQIIQFKSLNWRILLP